MRSDREVWYPPWRPSEIIVNPDKRYKIRVEKSVYNDSGPATVFLSFEENEANGVHLDATSAEELALAILAELNDQGKLTFNSEETNGTDSTTD